MAIYDETSLVELDSDIVDSIVAEGKGYVYQSQRQTGTIPEHFEVMEGTNGLRRRIPAKILYEDCTMYHEYTDEEIEAKKQAQASKEQAELESEVSATTDEMLADHEYRLCVLELGIS